MNSFIRLLIAASGLAGGAVCFPVVAEENPASAFTTLNSTTISGYVSGGRQWQPRTTSAAPTIGVVAIRPIAHEGKWFGKSPRSGAFKFFRSGDISKPLTIYFQVDGTATAGVDYLASSNGKPFPITSTNQPAGSYAPASASGTIVVIGGPPVIINGPLTVTNIPPPVGSIRTVDPIVIPAGRRSAILNIDPKDDRQKEMAESVIVSISSDSQVYPSRASVQIIDND